MVVFVFVVFMILWYFVMSAVGVLYVGRVNWTQSLIWPYYFVSDVFGDGYDKRPLRR